MEISMLRVKNATFLQDRQGRAVCGIYNERGQQLVTGGQAIPDSLLTRAVFIMSESASLIRMNQDPAPRRSTADLIPADGSDDQMLKRYYSERMIRLYHQTFSRIKEIFSSTEFSSETLSAAEEIVDECYSADLYQLRGILGMMAKKDDYVINHSFSVFLLFLQSVNDFKECIHEEGFYDTFKQRTAKVNFNRDSIKKYALGALLHDFGKVFIPKEILVKPGALSFSEYEVVKKHSLYGVKSLMNAGVEDQDLLRVVGDHHASYRSYKREDQNPLAQICNILDVYDATQTDRVYKPAVTYDESLAILYMEKRKNGWSDFLFNHLMNRSLPDFKKSVLSRVG